ncbi:MAG: adenylyltransferase/cytidyltransferase family protein [Actinomycetota bacterium]
MAQPTLVIVSGYFGPIHVGHLDYIEAGAAAGDELFVIVNNNVQQTLKKGKVIIDEADRLRIVEALRVVDHAMIATDTDGTVCDSIEAVAQKFPDHRIIFGNGGDRNPDADMPPEVEVCERHGIEMIFDMGGNNKADSSSRLIEELGLLN